jgi:hypothetical protein
MMSKKNINIFIADLKGYIGAKRAIGAKIPAFCHLELAHETI